LRISKNGAFSISPWHADSTLDVSYYTMATKIIFHKVV